MKKALAVISFGTTHPDARQSIARIERALCEAMPDCDFYRAFTSSVVRSRLPQRRG